MTLIRRPLLAGLLMFPAHLAHAGMPSALPIDYEYAWRLTDSTQARVQAISFFLVGLLLSTAVFRWVWNSLQVQFPRLPRISFPRALGMIFLWGLLAIVVLTMISGARELMTPGAWEKQGLTYKVAARDDEQTSAAASEPPTTAHFSVAERKAALEKLKHALWAYAAEHDNQFPAGADEIAPAELWHIPGTSGLRFIYLPGSRMDDSKPPFLVYEPAFDHSQRWMLSPAGEIRPLTPGEFNKWRYPSYDE